MNAVDGQDIYVAGCVAGAGDVSFFLASDDSFVRTVYFFIPSTTCVVDLGTISGTRTLSGRWESDCRGFHDYQYDREARYYIFSVASAADVQIDLMPRTDLTPQTSEAMHRGSDLYLVEGAELSGRTLAEDHGYFIDGSVNSRIETQLPAGTYTIEAGEFYCCDDETELSFTLTVTVGGAPPPPPPPAFTDDPLVAGVTAVKAVHVNELRARIDAVRNARGLSAFPWTDQPVSAGFTPIKAVHLSELRAALDQAYGAAARPRPSYTDSASGSTIIKAVHIQELRMAVVALQ